MTNTIITDRDILSLRREAADHGDEETEALCLRALGEDEAEMGTWLSDLIEGGTTPEQARESVEAIIAYARMRAAEGV